MKTHYLLLFLFILFNTYFSQNRSNVSVNNKSPIIKIDSSSSKAERSISKEEYNELLGKIVILEKEIADNKQSFFESIANWYSFALICLSIAIGLLGIFGYRSLGRRFDDHQQETAETFDNYRREMAANIDQLREIISYQINEKLNIELQKIDANRKSFYDTTINDLVRKYYDLSSILETLKIVYLKNTGNSFIPTTLSNDEELIPTKTENAFDDNITLAPNNDITPEENNGQ